MKRAHVLAAIEHASDEFGSLVTTSQVPRRDVMRCVAAGLVASVGMVTVCDGDGRFVERERLREGFRLTAAGRAELHPGI